MRTIKLLLFALFLFAGTAAAQVSYINADGQPATTTEPVTTITAAPGTLGTADTESWYLFSSSWTSGTILIQGDVHIILADQCNVTVDGGGTNTAGINVSGTNSLTIYAQSAGTGMGQLTAYGNKGGEGRGAGIGGGLGGSGGIITITGGTVTAYSSLEGDGYGAGIGGGNNGSGSEISISGGTVTAYSSGSGWGLGWGYGAGIGGGDGYGSGGGDISITGGVVTAYSSLNGTGSGAGIGGGHNGSGSVVTGSSINIDYGSAVNASVTAKGLRAFSDEPNPLTGIGWYRTNANAPYTNNGTTPYTYAGTDTYVSLLSAKQTAQYLNRETDAELSTSPTLNDILSGDIYGTTLGTEGETTWYLFTGGWESSGTIRINGIVNIILEDKSNVTVNGGINVTGSNSLTIYAQSTGDGMGELTAYGNRDVEGKGAGIGGGQGGAGGTISITGGTVTAYSSLNGIGNGAGIGGGQGGAGGTITISGGTVTAYSSGSGLGLGAGIGGGDHGGGGTISIISGVVTAYSAGGSGTGHGAGIGGGQWGAGGTINITGGTVTAYSSLNGTGNGAGIGGGNGYSGGTIEITGGTVRAYSSLEGNGHGAGIGGGLDGSGDEISITGGTVTAYSSGVTNYGWGAGIGGGSYSAGGVVTGGSITINYSSAVNASVTAKGARAFSDEPTQINVGGWKTDEDDEYTAGEYPGPWTVIYLSLKSNDVPDESTWTGDIDNNWANAGNWNPGVPGAITTATIPGGRTNYPVLQDGDKAIVDQLVMGYGAELGNQHFLTYNTAQVQYDFTSEGIERSRYHFITAPLQDMVSGDYFFGGKPEVWLRYAQTIEAPVTGGEVVPESFVTLDMTLDVAHNVVDLPAGFGWAYKVDPPVYGNNLRDFNHILTLPKFEQESNDFGYNQHEVWEADENKSHFYYYYIGFPDVRINNPAYHDVKVRSFHNEQEGIYLGSRFITEAFGDEMPLHGTDGTNPVLMGNPYLAHLDFAKLYNENSSSIENSFQYYDGTGMQAVMVTDDGIVSTDSDYPESDGLIRPLTAVFITPKAGTNSVVIDAEMTTTDGGWGLRVGAEYLPPATKYFPPATERAQNIAPLRVNLEYAGYTSTVVVLYDHDERMQYAPTDGGVMKIFSDQSIPELYIRQDEQAKAIATFDGSTRMVPLGIRNAQGIAGQARNDMSITLSGVEAFEAAGISVSLHETNGDYYIVFSPGSETGIDDVWARAENIPPLQAVPTADGISINGLIPGETFSIVNMQGQLIYRGTAVGAQYFAPVQANGAYIIVAGDRTAKVVR